MTSMVSDFRHTRLYITMVDVILTSGSSDRAFRTTCPDIRHRVSKHCQRHHQGNLKFIMRFYRLESDNLRVTLAAIIERFHTRHGNRRTTLSDTTYIILSKIITTSSAQPLSSSFTTSLPRSFPSPTRTSHSSHHPPHL